MTNPPGLAYGNANTALIIASQTLGVSHLVRSHPYDHGAVIKPFLASNFFCLCKSLGILLSLNLELFDYSWCRHVAICGSGDHRNGVNGHPRCTDFVKFMCFAESSEL